MGGTLLKLNSASHDVLFNHARPGNCRHYNQFYSADEWDTLATEDIAEGDELCIDYDHSSGYESRPDEPHVQEYLLLLDRYEEEKRPSRLTLPPARFLVATHCSASAVTVRAADVVVLNDTLATARHPVKGNSLFARREIPRGSVVMHTQLDDIRETVFSCVKDLDEFLQTLPDLRAQQDVLMHTVPGPNGTLLKLNSASPHVFFNHGRPNNCRHYNQFYSADEWDTLATEDIAEGDELCIDYDHSSGYESRPNEPHVQEYLLLLDRYDEEKRPSRLTLPPAHFSVNP